MALTKIDGIRDALKVTDLSGLRVIIKEVVHKARENKVLDGETIDGLVVAAVDETQIKGDYFNQSYKACRTLVLEAFLC
jgi:hypothetical protein